MIEQNSLAKKIVNNFEKTFGIVFDEHLLKVHSKMEQYKIYLYSKSLTSNNTIIATIFIDKEDNILKGICSITFDNKRKYTSGMKISNQTIFGIMEQSREYLKILNKEIDEPLVRMHKPKLDIYFDISLPEQILTLRDMIVHVSYIIPGTGVITCNNLIMAIDSLFETYFNDANFDTTGMNYKQKCEIYSMMEI